MLELLPPLDHDSISYAPFNKSFYAEAHAVATMSDEDVAAYARAIRQFFGAQCSGAILRRRLLHPSPRYRAELGVRASGFDVPRPLKLFEHAGLTRELLATVKRRGYAAPTAIQAQALPVVLSGRDAIGIATTGSGKTAAYLLPFIVHAMDQPPLQKGDGPIGLVLAPTHELAEQVTMEARKFAKGDGLRAVGVWGGVGKYEQLKELKAGADIVVGTPGRLLELIRPKGGQPSGLSLRRVTYVVLDEADRMFSLGFEPQVRSLLGQVRPDRQTVLFSATFRPALERLARDALSEPVRVTVGEVGEANDDVTQVVEVLPNADAKWGWLVARLPTLPKRGPSSCSSPQRPNPRSSRAPSPLRRAKRSMPSTEIARRRSAKRRCARSNAARGSSSLPTSRRAPRHPGDQDSHQLRRRAPRRRSHPPHWAHRPRRRHRRHRVHAGHSRRVRRCRRPRSGRCARPRRRRRPT